MSSSFTNNYATPNKEKEPILTDNVGYIFISNQFLFQDEKIQLKIAKATQKFSTINMQLPPSSSVGVSYTTS